jgi:hypothetical protein
MTERTVEVMVGFGIHLTQREGDQLPAMNVGGRRILEQFAPKRLSLGL